MKFLAALLAVAQAAQFSDSYNNRHTHQITGKETTYETRDASYTTLVPRQEARTVYEDQREVYAVDTTKTVQEFNNRQVGRQVQNVVYDTVLDRVPRTEYETRVETIIVTKQVEQKVQIPYNYIEYIDEPRTQIVQTYQGESTSSDSGYGLGGDSTSDDCYRGWNAYGQECTSSDSSYYSGYYCHGGWDNNGNNCSDSYSSLSGVCINDSCSDSASTIKEFGPVTTYTQVPVTRKGYRTEIVLVDYQVPEQVTHQIAKTVYDLVPRQVPRTVTSTVYDQVTDQPVNYEVPDVRLASGIVSVPRTEVDNYLDEVVVAATVEVPVERKVESRFTHNHADPLDGAANQFRTANQGGYTNRQTVRRSIHGGNDGRRSIRSARHASGPGY